MPKYLIERHVPGVGRTSREDLAQLAAKSCATLRLLGPDIQWVQSYVTADKLTCVYLAANEEIIREHAARGGFPVTTIAQVTTMLDPVCAEAAVAPAASRS
jgi:hypothetical protein